MDRQQYVEKRIVSDEIIPVRLSACFANVDSGAAKELGKAYKTGKNPPGFLTELHKTHLLYLHDHEKSGYV